MHMKTTLYILLLPAFIVLSGCVSNSSTIAAFKSANRDLALQFSPFRFVTKRSGDRGSITTTEWAGTPGQSITHQAPQVRSDVLESFKSNCGFEESQIIETRIVYHKPTRFYEVWVFDDPKSERKDKKSALSLVMIQLPNNGGVDFSVHGDCHSKKGSIFYSP